MQCPPDADQDWLLAAVIQAIQGPLPPGPHGVDPVLLERWRIGRALLVYREAIWRRKPEFAGADRPLPPRFPYRIKTIETLEKGLQEYGCTTLNRQALTKCVGLAERYHTAIELPRQALWTVVRDETKTRPKSRPLIALDRAELLQRFTTVLPFVHPGFIVAGRSGLVIDGRMVWLQGQPDFIVRTPKALVAMQVTIAPADPKPVRRQATGTDAAEILKALGLASLWAAEISVDLHRSQAKVIKYRHVGGSAKDQPEFDATAWLTCALGQSRDPFDP